MTNNAKLIPIVIFNNETNPGTSMNFSKHTGLVAAKANKVIGVMKRSFDYMDKDMFTILHKTLIDH